MFSLLSLIGSTLFLSLRVSSGGGFPPPLTEEEEKLCLEGVARGDIEARNRLVEHNLRLVSHIIKKYYAASDSHDDLISIGTLGLIKAVNTFRPEKATRFSTYAARCVENEIFMHFRSARRRACEISLDQPLDAENEGGQTDLSEIIGEDDEEMLARLDAKLESTRLHKLVDTLLDARERRIICARYGLGGRPPETQRQIAERCGLSRSYVSRIEKRALEKLREGLEK